MVNNNKILVWFMTGNLPPRFSGAGKNDVLLAEHCIKNGLDITLVAPEHPLDKDKIKNGIKVLRMPNSETPLSKLSGALRIVKLLKKNKNPDVIRMRGFSFSRSIILAVIKLFFPKIKIIVQPAMLGGDDPSSILNRRFGKFVKKQLLRSDAIFAMNNIMKNIFLKNGFPKSRIYEVKNPVDTTIFKKLSSKEKLERRKALKLPEEAIIILTMGILCKRKNQSFITDGFKRFLQNSDEKNAYLVHVGPNSRDLKYLGRTDAIAKAKEEELLINKQLKDNFLGKRVLMVGNEKNPEKYLQAADCLVHASIEEGESNVVNEALSCGLPCIIPISNVYQRQVPRSCSLRFKPYDCNDLALCISKMINEIALCDSIGNACRKHILSSRSPEAVAKKYSSFLIKITSTT